MSRLVSLVALVASISALRRRRRPPTDPAACDRPPWRRRTELRLTLHAAAVAGLLTSAANAHQACLAAHDTTSPFPQAFSVPPERIVIPVAWSAALLYYDRRRLARDLLLQAPHCPTCGYDMRATPEQCPECGARRAAPRLRE